MRIGFFPSDSGSQRWEREIHPWPRLATDALVAAGHDVVGLGIGDLRRASVLSAFDVLHLNWPQSLMQPRSRKFRGKALQYIYRRWFFSKCIRSVNRLKRSGVPVVWQVHDLPQTSRRDDQELMDFLFRRFYELAGGLLFFEESAQEPFFQKFGPADGKLIGTAPLGDYVRLHGPARSKEAARKTLGLGDARKVIYYPGTVRWTRNPAGFIEPFLSQSDSQDILIISGRGTESISPLAVPNRVIVKPGAIDHAEFRDLMCAADYVVNDAPQYLGSAIIRAALGYGVPVIARSFGCTTDLARGAYIAIPEVPDGVAKAIQIALAIDPAEHRRMSEQAFKNHLARPWSAYAAGCSELYSRLVDQITEADRHGARSKEFLRSCLL